MSAKQEAVQVNLQALFFVSIILAYNIDDVAKFLPQRKLICINKISIAKNRTTPDI